MNHVEVEDSFIVLNNSFLAEFKILMPLAQEMTSGMANLFRVQSMEASTNDFSEIKEPCFMILYSGGGGEMIPVRYINRGLISLVKGSHLIPRKEDKNVLDGLDFDNEFNFSF